MASPRSTMPAFDTHKAVKTLCEAGFDDAQAEAVVEQINGAVTERLATKEDLERTEQNLGVTIASLATKEEMRAAIAPLATKEELRALRDDLREEVRALREETRTAIAPLATKEELRAYATKEDLAKLEVRMTAAMDALAGKLLRYMGGGLALVVALTKGLDLLVG